MINSSDYILFVSKIMEKTHKSYYQINCSTRVVENGFIQYDALTVCDEKLLQRLEKARFEKRMIIGYFGTGDFVKNRSRKNISSLFDVFFDNLDIARKVCMLIQGDVNMPKIIPDGLDIIKLPASPNKYVRANMQEVDICLFGHSVAGIDSSFIVGGKVYDYIASGTPLWLIVPNNSYSLLDLANKTGKPFVSNVFDQQSIKEDLLNILDLWNNGSLENYGFTKQESLEYSRDKQFEKILAMLK